MIEANKQDGVGTITFARAEKRNAMNPEMIHLLHEALTDMQEDATIHVIIINGQGEHFCAGADVSRMKDMAAASYEENYDDAQMLADLMYQIYNFPKPIIALAHGATLGGGLGVLAACDIAIAGESAKFGFSEVKIGVTPSTISPYVLAAIGERAASRYFLTGERFQAKEALRIGLVHDVVPDANLNQVGLTLAQSMLGNSPAAMKATKQLIHHVAYQVITPELGQKTAEHLANVRTTKQAREGLSAFLEKRTPEWS